MRCCLLLVVSFCLHAQQNDLAERIERILPPSNASAAASAFAQRDYATLESLLSAAQQSSERDAVRAGLAFLRNRFAESVAGFERAAQQSPLNERDRFTYAMALIESGDQTKAGSVLQALAAEHPKSALYLYWQGRLDYYDRRYDEALGKFKRAQDLDPSSVRIWNSLGLTYDMQGQQEEAQSALRKAAELNRAESSPSAWPPHDLGYLLLRLGELTQAEDYLRESLRYNPSLSETHYYLGRVLDKENKPAEAMKEYQIAVTTDPRSADACYSLAMLYRSQHRDQDAEQMFAEWKKRKAASDTGEALSARP